jgi:hypothetical protein
MAGRFLFQVTIILPGTQTITPVLTPSGFQATIIFAKRLTYLVDQLGSNWVLGNRCFYWG